MTETASILMQVCTENVYDDNVFYLLGLPTTATPRQVRRRKEDLESAHEMGEAAWKREFVHLMDNRPVPTLAEVNEAFGRLADPESRIVSEFFWVWPVGADDEAVNMLVAGKRADAIRIWEQGAFAQGAERLVAQHNLAVLSHSYAIDAERQYLKAGGSAPPDFYGTMCDYWEKAFSRWREMVDSDEFWEIFGSRMREFDDPRLTGGFIRRFRRQLPIAFDGMNARFAAEYVRLGKPSEARRHVGYMNKAIGGPDDAKEALRLLLEPIENRVGQLIDRHAEKVSNDPSEGCRSANELMDEVDEEIRLADFFRQNVADIDEAAMARLLSRIATACNSFQVSYGNKTERWEDCLAILKRIQPLACTQEIKDVIRNNIEAVESNIRIAQLTTRCWFCGKDHATETRVVPLYGEVEKEFWGNRVSWKQTSVNVPICAHCKKRERELSASVAKSTWLFGLAVDVFFFVRACVRNEEFTSMVGAFFLGVLVVFFAWLLVSKLAEAMVLGHERKIKSFPPVAELLAEGYSIGEKPPNVQ